MNEMNQGLDDVLEMLLRIKQKLVDFIENSPTDIGYEESEESE